MLMDEFDYPNIHIILLSVQGAILQLKLVIWPEFLGNAYFCSDSKAKQCSYGSYL